MSRTLPGQRQLLTVVVPCYNEEPVIRETHRQLMASLAGLRDLDVEVLYVNDGSKDATAEILRALQQADPRVRVVSFARNFGHQLAVTAGIDHAAGDAVVLIDADLQDPPEVIHTMVERWREGYQVAYGVRVDREGETKFKLATAKAFYRLLNKLSDTPIPLDTGDFRLMDRAVVEALRAMPERDRFVRGMVSWVGFRQVAVPYNRARRLAGESKYPLFKMLRFALDGIASFSVVPLRAVTYLGFVVSALAVLGIVYALALRIFTNDWVTGWTAIFISILFLGGVQLISVGIIGEYVGRIYGESKRRPLYLVGEQLGFSAPNVLGSVPGHGPHASATRGTPLRPSVAVPPPVYREHQVAHGIAFEPAADGVSGGMAGGMAGAAARVAHPRPVGGL